MTQNESREEMKKAMLANLAKLNAACGDLTEEDRQFEADQQRRLDEFHSRYPGNDGSETAWLLNNGSIHVSYSSRTTGTRGSGYVDYNPDDAEFEKIWNRHKMSEANGRLHFIMKKWNEEKQVWIDLGDGWGAVVPPL